jgi:hypothetical protein
LDSWSWIMDWPTTQDLLLIISQLVINKRIFLISFIIYIFLLFFLRIFIFSFLFFLFIFYFYYYYFIKVNFLSLFHFLSYFCLFLFIE